MIANCKVIIFDELHYYYKLNAGTPLSSLHYHAECNRKFVDSDPSLHGPC